MPDRLRDLLDFLVCVLGDAAMGRYKGVNHYVDYAALLDRSYHLGNSEAAPDHVIGLHRDDKALVKARGYEDIIPHAFELDMVVTEHSTDAAVQFIEAVLIVMYPDRTGAIDRFAREGLARGDRKGGEDREIRFACPSRRNAESHGPSQEAVAEHERALRKPARVEIGRHQPWHRAAVSLRSSHW